MYSLFYCIMNFLWNQSISYFLFIAYFTNFSWSHCCNFLPFLQIVYSVWHLKAALFKSSVNKLWVLTILQAEQKVELSKISLLRRCSAWKLAELVVCLPSSWKVQPLIIATQWRRIRGLLGLNLLESPMVFYIFYYWASFPNRHFVVRNNFLWEPHFLEGWDAPEIRGTKLLLMVCH